MSRAQEHSLIRQGAMALIVSVGIALALRLWVLSSPLVLHGLYRGRDVELLRPGWLYLLCLTPYFWLVAARSLTDLSVAQQALGALLRSLVLAGLAVALARPTAVTEDSKVATVFLIDVSPSVSDAQLAAAQRFVGDAARAKRDQDHMAVVSFAERPRLLPLGEDGEVPLARRHEGEVATDLQAALQLSYGLFPPGYLPRVVLLSDGNQTSGDLLAEAYKASDFGVHLSFHVVPAEAHKEIRVVALHLPEDIKVGAPFELLGELWSTHEEEVTLALRQDDFPNGLEPHKTVKLHEGKNLVPFRSEAKAAGFTTYTLRLKAAREDTSQDNNETVATAPVQGKPRILYVEGAYDRQPEAAGYLRAALARENIDVEVRGTRGVPSSEKELERYDLVLVSDVASTFLGLAEMQALEAYVRDLGGGFVMAGGEDSFGSGGYQGTRIEKILPVRFEGERQIEQPRVALALVIDRSGSMSGEKLEMAKESARATAEALLPTDMISVVAFDNSPITVVRLQKASNRLRISTDIARLQPGGGTNILPALQEAYNILSSANAKVKHVILLSDGQAAYEGIGEVCDEMRSSRITVSAVGVGDADRTLLQLIAERGDGRLYLTDNASDLPKIFTKETSEMQKSSLVEENVTVHVVKRVEMIEGVPIDSAPPLHGYVSTKPKPMSEVVLASDLGEPLLARWRVGLGQVVAWTSDVKNRWASEWLSWPGYTRFWAQIVRTTMRRSEHERYDLGATVEAGRAHVVVDAEDKNDHFVNDLETTLEVVDPRTSKTIKTLPMALTAAGRYEAEFPVDRYGTYVLKAQHRRDGNVVAESLGAVALAYPDEYLRSTPNAELLGQAALVTRGLAQLEATKSFSSFGESLKYPRDLWPQVLLAVAVLFLLDVYLRRVRLFGYRALRL
jgi:Mg-chelatase subunit ChlD